MRATDRTFWAVAMMILVAPVMARAQTSTAGCDPNKDPLCNLTTTIASAPPVSAASVSITPHPSWKNTLGATDDFQVVDMIFDPLLGATGTKWAKFTILTEDPTKVYFQNSNDYKFHYDFATERLDPFVGMSRLDYDAISLHTNGQKALLGAVILPFSPLTHEVGIQLVGQDAYDRDTALQMLELVKAGLDVPADTKFFYFPTFEQSAAAEAEAAFFEARGFPIASTDRWLGSDQCYAPGWAQGPLVFVPGAEIDDAYSRGDLKPTDILLTDGVPAEVPYVAGIISLSSSTPNSHVAILAESYGVPFVYASDAVMVANLQSLVGKEVGLTSSSGFGRCGIDVFDLANVDPAQLAEIVALKTPGAVDIQPKVTSGQISYNVDDLGNNDVARVGGKAANYKLLRESIPDHAPEAVAFTFDLWDRFMDQTLAVTGQTLRKEIADRLAGLTFPADINTIHQRLDQIRHLIRDDAVFDPTTQQEITSALSGFDPSRKIRFRSSTNVEDSDTFTGAGLYSSRSGCVADDTDADDIGPSACNADQPEERGAYRAIQRVFASFYNDNAYLERLRRGVDEEQAGMAVLAHYSFPDEIERGNGVATLSSRWGTNVDLRLVSQPGANSVTNPASSARPEVVEITVAQWGTDIRKVQNAALLQLGDTVFEWQTEYQAFVNILSRAGRTFVNRRGLTQPYKLDFEYKKLEGDQLIVKQIRPVPVAGDETVPAFVVNKEVELCVFQGEYSNVFANHQLKARMKLAGRNTWLKPADLASTLLSAGTITVPDGGGTSEISGDVSTWPDKAYELATGGEETIDRWKTTTADNAWVNSLSTQFTPNVRADAGPFTSVDRFVMFLTGTFETPVLTVDWTNTTTTTDTQTVRVVPCSDLRAPMAGQSVRNRTFDTPGGVKVETSYVHPPPPRGITAGYTAPLVRWEGTTITGLTSQPIEMKGYYSQTYRPGHHNFSAAFIFEPRLEDGIDPAILAELQAKDIQQIYVNHQQDVFAISSTGVVTQIQ